MERHRFIALCGAPLAGKSTVAGILSDIFGYQIIDDKAPLRAAAMELYGLTYDQVSTQSGKSQIISVGGREMTIRKALGELAKFHERAYGNDFFAIQAIEKARAIDPDGKKTFVFPSVRMRQGWAYKSAGGVVVEVKNPATSIAYDFDDYDQAAVDGVIENHIGLSQAELIEQIQALISSEPLPAFSC